MAIACSSASLHAASVDSLKSLDLGDFEITRVREIKSPSELGLKPSDGVKTFHPVVCVEVSARKDSDTRVTMNIALPLHRDWNKVYVALGNGGLGDGTSLDSPYYAALGGYAASHNDLGTKDWQKNPNRKSVIADFGHRAIYRTAIVSQRIIAAYYGESPRRSYYTGGSTGGQEGLSLAERHPELFDGIAVFYPVTNRTRLHTRHVYEHKVLAAKKYFTPEEVARISSAIVAQNRSNAGEYSAKDYPFLKNPEVAKCDYSKLTFLTPEQIEVLKKIHDTVKNSKGEYVTVGLAPSAELADGGKSLLNNSSIADWIYPMGLGTAFNASRVNFDEDLKKVEAMCATDCNALPNLEQFVKLGRRLLIVQGKLDTVVPSQYVKEYYDTLAAHNGGLAKTRDFARIFFVPGMWHCSQVDCDVLACVRKWVEEKAAPASIDIGVQYQGSVYHQKIAVY